MDNIEKEFKEKFCYEMMNFDHTNRHHYIMPSVVEKPQLIIDWIKQQARNSEKIINEIESKVDEMNKNIKWEKNGLTGEINSISFSQILEDLPELLRAKYLEQL